MNNDPATFTIPGDSSINGDMVVEVEHPAIFGGFLAFYGAKTGTGTAQPSMAQTNQWMREACDAARRCGLCKIQYNNPGRE